MDEKEDAEMLMCHIPHYPLRNLLKELLKKYHISYDDLLSLFREILNFCRMMDVMTPKPKTGKIYVKEIKEIPGFGWLYSFIPPKCPKVKEKISEYGLKPLSIQDLDTYPFYLWRSLCEECKHYDNCREAI